MNFYFCSLKKKKLCWNAFFIRSVQIVLQILLLFDPLICILRADIKLSQLFGMRKQVQRDEVTWMWIQQRQYLKLGHDFRFSTFSHYTVVLSASRNQPCECFLLLFFRSTCVCNLTHFCWCSWFSNTFICEEPPLKAFVNNTFYLLFQKRIKGLVIGQVPVLGKRLEKTHRYQCAQQLS